MDNTELQLIRDTAVSAAKCAGGYQKDRFQKQVELFSSSQYDLTTMIDKDSSDIIVNHIGSVFPSHSMLCEESSYVNGTSEYEWVIDPLDGSVNYFLGIPYYCVSIACYRNAGSRKEPLCGVVYAPSTEELFVAVSSGGAFLNGRRIVPDRGKPMGEGAVAVSMGSSPEVFRRVHSLLPAVFEGSRKVRSMGATALDVCRVASGGLTGLFQMGVKEWDFAAGRIVLEAAGGCFSYKEERDGVFTILAGNTTSMPEMEEVFRWKAGVMS
ncbi:MAG: hypothetical protein JXB03_05430 [Spirochaetales bacterium]|nr:hypothetical protein [Spirochaetales bacterium]